MTRAIIIISVINTVAFMLALFAIQVEWPIWWGLLIFPTGLLMLTASNRWLWPQDQAEGRK